MKLCDDALHCGCSDLFELSQKEKERLQKDNEQLRNALRNLLSRVANDADAHAWWMSEQEEAIKALGEA